MVNDAPAMNQAYVGVNGPSSASTKVAEQVNGVPVTTALLGVIVMDVDCGGVLSMVTLVFELTDEPFASVTVAVQLIMSEPLTNVLFSCQVEPVLVSPEV